MKIEKWISIEQQVEVEIGWEDVAALLRDVNEAEYFTAISAAYMVLKAVDIGKMSPSRRDVVAGALLEQADRFKVQHEQ